MQTTATEKMSTAIATRFAVFDTRNCLRTLVVRRDTASSMKPIAKNKSRNTKKENLDALQIRLRSSASPESNRVLAKHASAAPIATAHNVTQISEIPRRFRVIGCMAKL